MRDEAGRFCQLIESAGSTAKEEFAAELFVSIAGLVAMASRLPNVSPTDAELPDGPSHDEWKRRYDAIYETLGEWADYWTTMTTADYCSTPDPVSLTLADDLADIWRDLKSGLLALDTGASAQDVIWDWRFAFYSHWGSHAVEALRALHARLVNVDGPPSNTETA